MVAPSAVGMRPVGRVRGGLGVRDNCGGLGLTSGLDSGSGFWGRGRGLCRLGTGQGAGGSKATMPAREG